MFPTVLWSLILWYHLHIAPLHFLYYVLHVRLSVLVMLLISKIILYQHQVLLWELLQVDRFILWANWYLPKYRFLHFWVYWWFLDDPSYWSHYGDNMLYIILIIKNYRFLQKIFWSMSKAKFFIYLWYADSFFPINEAKMLLMVMGDLQHLVAKNLSYFDTYA